MYKLPEEITREIFEEQLRETILSHYKDDNQRRIRKYILEVSERLNSHKDSKDEELHDE